MKAPPPIRRLRWRRALRDVAGAALFVGVLAAILWGVPLVLGGGL